MIQKTYLIIQELLSGRFISLIVFFSIMASTVSFGLFQVIGDNFNGYIRDKFVSSIPPNTIRVSSVPDESFLFFNVRSRKTPLIDDRILARIRGMRGVRAIHPVMVARVPIQARINLFGLGYTTDLLCMGAGYPFVAGDLTQEKYRAMWRNPDMEKGIPVLFPRIILKAYNEGMAEPNRLPRIQESFVTGMGIQVLFGYSSIRRMADFVTADAVIAGFTDSINSLAIVVPLSVTEHYNKKFNPAGYSNEYLYAFVKVADHDSLITVTDAVRSLGLLADAEKKVSDSILTLKKNVNLVLGVLKYLIIALALLAVSFSTMIATFNRLEYYRILRILGASKIFISFSILFKYFIIGLSGSWAGLELMKRFASGITEMINVSIIKISLAIPPDLQVKILVLGSLIPVASTLPGIFRLFSRKLNRD